MIPSAKMADDDDDMTEESLLAAWRSGDRKAGDALVARYFDELTGYFRNKVSRDDDVTDLVAQSFLGCTSSVEGFRGESKFRTFLYGIARRQLMKHIRKRYKLEREKSDFEEVCVAELDRGSVSTMVLRKREARALVAALRKIPLKFQTVLEMRYFSGLSGVQIAERLGIGRGTVQRRLKQGREALRATVERELGDEPARVGQTVTYSELADWAHSVRRKYGWPEKLIHEIDDLDDDDAD